MSGGAGAPVTAGPPWVGVVGPGEADESLLDAALEAGRAVGRGGAVLVCGGLGGVMEAACRGAEEEGGVTVGVLPGFDRGAANEHVQLSIPTGLGEARNALVVRAADAVVAIGGGFGTLSEIALALKADKPVVGVRTWEIGREGEPAGGIETVADGTEAVGRALERLGLGRP